MTIRRRWAWIAIAAGALALAWTVWLAAGGAGWFVTILGIRISSRDPFRSLTAGAVLAALGLSGIRITSEEGRNNRWITAGAACLASVTVVLGLTYGTFVAGAADAYGYVSQAALWANGSVIVDAPLAADATWPDAAWALTPVGYRPARQHGAMVPVYPPGLPLTMAVMKLAFGETGVYLVVPLLGGLAVWLTYLFGREIYGPPAGLFAAVALFASPVFLLQLMAPMSDVPATAWWLLSVVLGLKAGPRWVIASGFAAAIAILTRPNLVVLELPLLFLVLRQAAHVSDRIQRALLWGVPAACGPIAVAIINTALYGSPVASGYGPLTNLYSLSYTWRNLAQYVQWMVTTQTPFILLGIIATPWLVRGKDKRIAWLIQWSFVFAACVFLSYLWYLPFDNWAYLRFLLPAYPMLLAAAAAGLLMLANRRRWSEGFVIGLGLVLACCGLWQGRLAFRVAQGEARYRAAGEVARTLPPNAVIISNLHSGSVRYYADRLTLRYEWLGSDAYDAAVHYLRDHSRSVYVMLDETEIDSFRQRYRSVTDLSWLDRPPLATVANRVYLYALPQ
jgi:hypothetical protein